MGPIPKPQLRNLLMANTKRTMIGMTIASISVCLLYRTLVMAPRKKRYAEFYKTYDAEKAFRIMAEAGLLDSVTPPLK